MVFYFKDNGIFGPFINNISSKDCEYITYKNEQIPFNVVTLNNDFIHKGKINFGLIAKNGKEISHGTITKIDILNS